MLLFTIPNKNFEKFTVFNSKKPFLTKILSPISQQKSKVDTR